MLIFFTLSIEALIHILVLLMFFTLDTYLCIVSVFYLLNGGLDIRGRELLLGYPPVSASVDSANKKKIVMSTVTMIMMRQ